MKKLSQFFYSLVIMHAAFEYVKAMELSYSLTEKLAHTIDKQKKRYGSVAQEIKPKAIEQLSLSNIRDTFCAMSITDKRAVIKNMSTQLLLLSCAATYLPEEVTQHISCFFLDDHQEAIELFCSLPIKKALNKYNYIATRLQDPTKPVGPLYILSHESLDALLDAYSHSTELEIYSSTNFLLLPTFKPEILKALDGIPNETKQLYVKNKVLMGLPLSCSTWDVTNPKELIEATVASTGIGSLTFGVLEGMSALLPAMLQMSSFACEPTCLSINSGISTLVCLSSFISLGYWGCVINFRK